MNIVMTLMMVRLASDADDGNDDVVDDFRANMIEWRHNMFLATASDAFYGEVEQIIILAMLLSF